MPHPTIQLRDITPEDLPILFQQQLDPEANRLAVVHPRDAAAFDAHWATVLADPAIIAKAILADGDMVGHISCFNLDGQNAIGYWIAKDHWGRGIATRALTLFLDYIPTRPLHARAAATNTASMRVLQKCGFILTGHHLSPATDRFPECEEALLTLADPHPSR